VFRYPERKPLCGAVPGDGGLPHIPHEIVLKNPLTRDAPLFGFGSDSLAPSPCPAQRIIEIAKNSVRLVPQPAAGPLRVCTLSFRRTATAQRAISKYEKDSRTVPRHAGLPVVLRSFSWASGNPEKPAKLDFCFRSNDGIASSRIGHNSGQSLYTSPNQLVRAGRDAGPPPKPCSDLLWRPAKYSSTLYRQK
jgi:hypothetical protein